MITKLESQYKTVMVHKHTGFILPTSKQIVSNKFPTIDLLDISRVLIHPEALNFKWPEAAGPFTVSKLQIQFSIGLYPGRKSTTRLVRL